MDTILKEKIDSFFIPYVTPFLFTSFQHNIISIKKDSEIQDFCNRELDQSILYINKHRNIGDLPDDIMKIIRSYLFKEYISCKCIKFYWYTEYMNILSTYETEDRFDIMWYSTNPKNTRWARKRLLVTQALKKTLGLRLGYKESDLISPYLGLKYSRVI